MNLIVLFLFFIASEKPVSHEAHSTGQCSGSAEPAARHITSESSLAPGTCTIVATTLGCSIIFLE